jgi:Lar family restriction alleviation protein
MTSIDESIVLTTELLPCPFCGGEAHVSGEDTSYISVMCDGCFAQSRSLKYRDESYRHAIIKAWNRRVQPDASKLRQIAVRIANERGNFRKRAPWTGDYFLYEEVAHILSILTEELEGGQK